MRFGINLRGDLAKLDDKEISLLFEKLLGERAAMYEATPAYTGNKWLYQNGLGLFFGRGPFHARIFYKITGFLSYYKSSLYDLYLLDCELKDIRDELRSRVKKQKAIGLAS